MVRKRIISKSRKKGKPIRNFNNKRLAEYINKSDKTALLISSEIGIDPSQLHGYYSGRTVPSRKNLHKLENYFGISFTEVYKIRNRVEVLTKILTSGDAITGEDVVELHNSSVLTKVMLKYYIEELKDCYYAISDEYSKDAHLYENYGENLFMHITHLGIMLDAITIDENMLDKKKEKGE